ncbi:uncharacterized protein LOC112455059 [Temnothorax curvispinosus]|uniref:Uncharacterized protein LOC112455059 n=1 Tax=Temnothorax curvispinosus TaxID=300111 RepID=A0A6J1PRT6_9HYME|nr:uncharacterized protein LOC112455059 [Temnothorax curvispinosus]
MTRILGMLPTKLHHFRTAWDNVSGEDKNISKLFERLRLEEDRLNEGKQSSESQNALISKQDEAVSKLDVFMKMVENKFDRKIKCLRSDNGTEIKNADTKKLLDELGIFHTRSNVYTLQQNGRIEREMRTVVVSARSAIHAQDMNENLWAEAILCSFHPKSNWNKFNHKRAKTEKKSKKGFFVGYDLDSPCYRVYLPEEKDIACSDNHKIKVRVQEESLKLLNLKTYFLMVQTMINRLTTLIKVSLMTLMFPLTHQIEISLYSNLRDRRNLKPPAKFGDYILGYFRGGNSANVAMIGEVEDISVSDALKDENWRKAMSEELSSLIKIKTWDLVKHSKQVQLLTCRWILRRKQDGRFKARLVARGFEQKEGIDYSETFNPVAHHVSIRLIFSLAASDKMKLMTFDIKTAFLYGNLKEEIFMHQPEGFNDGTGRIYEDDMIEVLNKLKQKFEITFDIARNGKLSYLSMQIQNSPNGIFVSQPKYTEKILQRFKFDLLNPASTPMKPGMVTAEKNRVNDKPLEKSEPYREALHQLLKLNIELPYHQLMTFAGYDVSEVNLHF